MGLLKFLLISLLGFSSVGCQIGFYVKSAYNQGLLLGARTNMEEALKDPTLTEDEKSKMRLSQLAREFAQGKIHLKATKNYSRFVKLNRPFVTYVVNAAPKWELKHHEWSYPFVGRMPYKGYFNEQDAAEEEKSLQKEGLDTYLRGVSAFSTLGWFEDPLMSSMLRYSDYDLVDTIIHEMVHTTLYIKNSADFNERMAVFVGMIGTEAFYVDKEGKNSPTILENKKKNEDEKIFSQFMSDEIKSLEQWYAGKPEQNEELRQKRFQEILDRFKSNIEPKLKSKNYSRFGSTPLNNARILLFKTYSQDLSDFEKLYELSGKDIQIFLEKCRSLEKHPKPEIGLKELITGK